VTYPEPVFEEIHDTKDRVDIVAKLREAFVERAVLPASDVIEHELQNTEYPLQNLKGYYDSAPDNTLNDKDAYIYAFNIRHQFEQLKKLAKEVDEEFQNGEGASNMIVPGRPQVPVNRLSGQVADSRLAS
jgi:hypothetical protein